MDTNYIWHSGVAHDENPPGRGSGRYAWGSGENPNQHQFDFLSEVKKLKEKGFTESEIARALLGQKGVDKKTGDPVYYNSTDLRAEISIQKTAERKALRAQALKLYDECHGNVSEVGRRMGKNESSVRSLLKESINERQDRYQKTADFLRQKIDEQGMVDVSSGVELFMGVPDYTKKVAIEILRREGYVKTWVQLDQQFGRGNKTTTTVLARKPGEGETEKDVRSWVQHHKYEVGTIQEFTPDKGKTWWTPEFPEMLDSKRVMVRYAEDGGKDKDGVIEIRKGVEDVSLGGSQYAQVRIGVDGTHYLKGMAMYGDDSEFPDGIDIVFNTNKHRGTPMLGPDDNTVLKPLKRDKNGNVDRENPFGALIKNPKENTDGIIMAGGQRHYVGSDGKDHFSPINKLRDEGDWDSWSRNLSSQFLSKQPLKLIKQQLDLSVKDKQAELDEIMALTNPVIKKKMLEDYAKQADSSAARLSAKGFKGQAFQVILPLPSAKEDEVYAPMFKDGDTVALIRYPHGGTFEIPILKVNNRMAAGKKVMENAKDAIGIHPKVAERLSGADFDGDTALVIPLKSNNIAVVSKDPRMFGNLVNFDPKELYSLPADAPTITDKMKGTLMGQVTNLITDMTVAGATPSEIGRAVRHSMVVIDAKKHHLDYKQSALDNDIAALKRKYQGVNAKGQPGSTATVLSRAHSPIRINERKELTDTKKMTPEQLERWNRGEIVYVETGKTKMTLISDPKKMTPEELERYNSGKKVYRQTNEKVQQEIHRMDFVKDAMELVHDPTNPKERAYAEYANILKDLANQARKDARAIEPIHVNKEASKTYAEEVASLREKVRQAKMNAPRERRAQALAGAIVSERFASNPDMDYEHRQRERARALIVARAAVGAKKDPVVITDREWEAIQADAVSSTLLESILNNTDQDKFKQRATPRNRTALSPAMQDLARSMASSGMYTNADIAERCGVSASTIAQLLRNS